MFKCVIEQNILAAKTAYPKNPRDIHNVVLYGIFCFQVTNVLPNTSHQNINLIILNEHRQVTLVS